VEKEEALKITGHTQMQKNLNEEGNRGESEREGRKSEERGRSDNGVRRQEKRERVKEYVIICMRG